MSSQLKPHQSANSSCLICLEDITKSGSLQKHNNNDEDISSPSPLLLSDVQKLDLSCQKTESKGQPEVYRKFLQFCKMFLDVKLVSRLPPDDHERVQGGFCEPCHVLAIRVVQAYSEWHQMKMKLLWKVGELGEVIASHPSNTFSSIAEKLVTMTNKKERGRRTRLVDIEVQDFRKELVKKCEEKSREMLPFVILNKSFHPCEEILSFRTKSQLDFMIALIIIVCLGKQWDLKRICEMQLESPPSRNPSLLRNVGRQQLHGKFIPYELKLGQQQQSSGLKNNSIPCSLRCSKGNVINPRRRLKKTTTRPGPEVQLNSESNPNLESWSDDNGNLAFDWEPCMEDGEFEAVEVGLDNNDGDSGVVAMKVENYLLEKATQENKDTDNTTGLAVEDVKPRRLRPRIINKAKKHGNNEDFPVDPDDDDSHQHWEPRKKKGIQPSKRRRRSRPPQPPRVGVRGGHAPMPSQCKICSRLFTSQAKLRLHKRKTGHTTSKYMNQYTHPQKCTLCDEKFYHSLILFDHIVHNHQGGPDHLTLACGSCNKSLDYANDLLKHLKETHEKSDKKTNFCPWCSASFTTTQCLDIHRRIVHWREPPLFCDDHTCPESFASVDSLNNHMRDIHKIPQLAHCDICNRGFFSDYHCLLHQLIHKSKSVDGYYKCEEIDCTEQFRRRCVLMRHYHMTHYADKSTTTPTVDLLQCECCLTVRLYTFSQKDLDFHEKRRADRTYNCGLCSKLALTCEQHRLHLLSVEHLSKVANRKHEKLTCDICHEELESVLKLTLHKRLQHPNVVPKEPSYICEECGKSFEQKQQLQRHQFLHGDAKYPCPYCSQIIRKRNYLRIHINRKHTKKQVFICDVCATSCATQSELIFHRRGHEMMYACHLCPKKFGRKWTLDLHMRKHTGERLQCEWCPKRYTALNNMKTHVKASHPEEYEIHYGKTNQRTTFRYRIVNNDEKVAESGGGNGNVGNH